jgi:tetratricopeptide (TPR) repeat protein
MKKDLWDKAKICAYIFFGIVTVFGVVYKMISTTSETKKPTDSDYIEQHTEGNQSHAIVAENVYINIELSKELYAEVQGSLNENQETIDEKANTSKRKRLGRGVGTDTNEIIPNAVIKDKIEQELDKHMTLLKKIKIEKQYTFKDWYYKGAAEFNNEEYLAATISFKSALNKAPDDDKAISFTCNYRGAAYFNLGQPEKAFENYRAAIESFSENPLPHSNLARYYYHRKDYEKAFNSFMRASELYVSIDKYQRALDNIAETKSLLENRAINEKTKLTIKQEIEQLEMRLKRLDVFPYNIDF